MAEQRPLTGIQVVSLEQAAAAPLCTRRLALAGAEVIKIERPEGDFARNYDSAVFGESSYFVWLNAGKKSVVLDLKTEDGLTQLKALIDRADVLVQNLKPGALSALGIDLDELHKSIPELISVSITGFHPDGPGADRKAYDLLMQAESGLADITGSQHEAGRVGVSVVDASTGMYAYEAILEALLMRARTNQGAQISVALFDAVADLLTVPYLLERYGGSAPERVGLAHPGICPYGVFISADQQRFILSIQNEREWQRLCHLGLSRGDLLADVRCVDNVTRVANRTFVDGEVQSTFEKLNYTDIDRNLDRAGLAYAPVNGLAALKDHSDFHTYDARVGDQCVQLPIVPGHPAGETLSIPALGEHTDEVLDGLVNSKK
ncbi:MAG: CoA transferase [Pseudomonadales bacterium]|nr:CoA transferase [Pseudomonadales bacterium]